VEPGPSSTSFLAAQPHGLIADRPGVGQQSLDEAAARTCASHLRLDVHPLDLGDLRRQRLEATDADVSAGVPDDVEPAAGRIKFRSVVEIGGDHRLDIERQAVSLRSRVGDPAQVLGDQAPRRIARLLVIDRDQLDGGHVCTPGAIYGLM